MTNAPTLLLTRPQAQSERFASECLAALGQEVPVVISPILTIVPRDGAVDLAGVAGLIATSENAVQALAARADVAGRVAYCVGDRTADVAISLGMTAISAGGAVGDLVDLIRRAHPAGSLLYVHGEKVRGNLVAALSGAGIAVQSVVLYDQVPTELNAAALGALQGQGPLVVPLFSPRSAELVSQAATDARAPLAVVALSDAVARAWSGPVPVVLGIAMRPDAAAMLREIATIYTRLPT